MAYPLKRIISGGTVKKSRSASVQRKGKKDIQKTLPTHFQKLDFLGKGKITVNFVNANLCRMFGKEPKLPQNTALAVDQWTSWLRKNKDSLPPVRGYISVLALYTYASVEWAFYAACWMRRLGYAPLVLYSRKDISRLYGRPGRQSLKQKIRYGEFWKKLDEIPDMVSINLDEMPEPSTRSVQRFESYVSKQAHTDAAYKLFVEEHEQGPMKEEYERLVAKVYDSMLKETAQAYELMPKLRAEFGVDRLLGFSGTNDRFACYEGAAKDAGFTRMWVESWGILPGLMRYNIDQPALSFNVKDWIEGLEWTLEERQEMEHYLIFQETNEAEDSENKKSENHLRYQIVGKDTAWPLDLENFVNKDQRPLFLLATNVVGDSATFQRQTIFASQRNWISEVIQYFRNNPDKRLIVRAHPSERVYELHGNLNVNLGQVAAETAAGAENIFVIQWQDPVNTYSMIPYCRAGLTWVSNTGVDMIIRNVPVLSAAFPVYGGLGITKEQESKVDYFSWIKQLAENPEQPSSEQKEMAAKYLYVIYKKIGFPAFGPRYRASGLVLDHPLSSECARFYRILAGIE